jgi:hypothetical protein
MGSYKFNIVCRLEILRHSDDPSYCRICVIALNVVLYVLDAGNKENLISFPKHHLF